MKRRFWRNVEEKTAQGLMLFSIVTVLLILIMIVSMTIARGARVLSWEMLTQPPSGGFYLGGGGGILNAMLGSLYLTLGGLVLATFIALPIVLYLHLYTRNHRLRRLVRLALDTLWGIPGIVYGAFAFILMIAVGMRASLLAGIITLALVMLPILARTFDEVLDLVPPDLLNAARSLGATRLELIEVLVRQSLPGLVTAMLLGMGRGAGEAAAVLFTAGYTDSLPTSLARPVASLPLAVFFQLSTPFPEAQARAYAAALVLMAVVLGVSILARVVAAALGRYTIR
ncbi:MAG: ABC transporter permease subunit [Anaerolineae bacterium]|nr:ABC transporter permease subunit [Anaerolineae bacterium]